VKETKEERNRRGLSPHDYMERLKDPGQRLACGCIMSKDIGEYNTCPHLCHYCYANTNNAAAMENWKRHCECLCFEIIIEEGVYEFNKTPLGYGDYEQCKV